MMVDAKLLSQIEYLRQRYEGGDRRETDTGENINSSIGVKQPIDNIYQYISISLIDNIQPTARLDEFVPVISAFVVTVTDLGCINAVSTRRITTTLHRRSRTVEIR